MGVRTRYTLFAAGTGVLLLLAAADVTRADAIDGDWCRDDGKRMSIQGPDIVTPGGHRIKGDYSRHAFNYVVPPGEAGAGEPVAIVLLSEYLAHARQGAATAPVQVWNRCPPGIS
jgi:hypothetical protein